MESKMKTLHVKLVGNCQSSAEREFMVLNVHIWNEDKSPIHHLSFYLNKLEWENQIKPKVSTRGNNKDKSRNVRKYRKIIEKNQLGQKLILWEDQ